MPRKSTDTQPVALHTKLLEGFDVKARPDGSVITVKDATGKHTIAEVCVGKARTRVNFKNAPKSALSKQVSKGTTSWPGGGVVLTATNASQVRTALLDHAKASVPATPAPRKKKEPAVPATPRRTRSRKVAVAA